jgi:hypothetical protein
MSSRYRENRIPVNHTLTDRFRHRSIYFRFTTSCNGGAFTGIGYVWNIAGIKIPIPTWAILGGDKIIEKAISNAPSANSWSNKFYSQYSDTFTKRITFLSLILKTTTAPHTSSATTLLTQQSTSNIRRIYYNRWRGEKHFAYLKSFPTNPESSFVTTLHHFMCQQNIFSVTHCI